MAISFQANAALLPFPVSVFFTDQKFKVDPKASCSICLEPFSDKIQALKHRFYGHEVIRDLEMGSVNANITDSLLQSRIDKIFHLYCQDCHSSLDAENSEMNSRCPICREPFSENDLKEFFIDEGYQIFKKRPDFLSKAVREKMVLIVGIALIVLSGMALCTEGCKVKPNVSGVLSAVAGTGVLGLSRDKDFKWPLPLTALGGVTLFLKSATQNNCLLSPSVCLIMGALFRAIFNGTSCSNSSI